MNDPTQTPAWRALAEHARTSKASIADFFTADAQRAQTFSCEGAGLYLDFSKQRLSRDGLNLLLKLAEQRDLSGWIARLFAGDAVNHTEHRAALHVALRAPRDAEIKVDGVDVVPQVHEVLDRVCAFAQDVRSGARRGHTGERIRDVVNIGIGGSDLGPRMVCDALGAYADGPRAYFVANVDGAQISALFGTLDPATTLWIITSKTFTTQETMANAQAARAWFLRSAPESAVAKHFAAVSTNHEAVGKFGIAPENMFGFWDWVGGRYSLWSAVGLPVALALGPERFCQLLIGAHAMDEHFRMAPPQQNLPTLMGLIAVWNNNFLGAASQVIAPYAQHLEKFVSWLQQLEMESNGKSVLRDGRPVRAATTPAMWGDVGTNAQHAFFQMLHQGSSVHPVDFILPVAAGHPLKEQHRMLIANCLAQSAALMRGKNAAEVRAELTAKGMSGAELDAAIPHRVFPGNRPSSTLLLPRLDAYHLGALLALYEHRAFVMSVLWDINPFDQWGVELGKQLAQNILKAMDGGAPAPDASTAALLRRVAPDQ